jgi:uncharacterized protein (DUF433 family)
MTLPTLTALDVPLRMDETGTIRIGRTRVILDLVVAAFKEGDTPEQIIERYDSLKLAEVYAVIAYYLAHQPELDTYLKQRREAAEALRQEIESQPGDAERRAAMRARLEAQRGHKSEA